jgi:hypothetical protein
MYTSLATVVPMLLRGLQTYNFKLLVSSIPSFIHSLVAHKRKILEKTQIYLFDQLSFAGIKGQLNSNFTPFFLESVHFSKSE